jgi:hypothetical protein
MNRCKSLTLTIAAATMVVGLAGCATKAAPGPADATTAPAATPTTTAPAVPAAPGHYSVVQDLCTRVNIAAATAVLPFTDAQTSENLNTAAGTQMQCSMEIGYSDDFAKLATLQIEVDIDPTDAAAAATWKGNRDFEAAHGGNPKTVSGLGQGAFQSLDSDLGYQLDGYDGNAEIIIVFKGFEPEFAVPPGIDAILLGVATATLTDLRGGG